MVYELGHVGDQFKNDNIGGGDLRIGGGFTSNLHKKRRCGTNYVNNFIGNIAKNYMETTEGEDWASNLISHLNSRFPTCIAASKNFFEQKLQDANLHQIVSQRLASSHSPLPDLLVPPSVVHESDSLCSPENYMNLGYNLAASVNFHNPLLCGGSVYDEYSQNVACDGMNLISPLGIQQSDIDLITSPEQVSSITACSYGDVISDTEAFDSRAVKNSFQQQPFHNIGQFGNFTGKKRSAYNMDIPSLLVDDVQSPYPNSCNIQQNDSLQQPSVQFDDRLKTESDMLFVNSENIDSEKSLQAQHADMEIACDMFSFQVLSAYIMYKDMPADLRREVSFQDYMHSAECKENFCKCSLYLELASHYDMCNDLNCSLCGPPRSLSDAGRVQLESRKRKIDISETTDSMSYATSVDALPTKYPKLESSRVGDKVSLECGASLNNQNGREDAVEDDDQRRNFNGADGEENLTGLNQSINTTSNEVKKSPDLSSLKERTSIEKDKSSQVYQESVLDMTGAKDGLNSTSHADKSDLNSKKITTPTVSLVDCNSVLVTEKTEIKIASSADNDSRLEPEKVKIQSVSLADLFTADQIRGHLLSFTSQKDVSGNRAPSSGHNTCQLCSMDKLVFAPAPIYCSSCDTRIKRNVGYFRSKNEIGIRHCFCMSCYRGSHGTNIVMRGFSIPKAHLLKAKNDEEKEDSWVLCDKCQCWQHRICGLYNDEKDIEGKAEYICPKCYLQEIESGIRVPLPQTTASGAKDLPRTNLSDHIERRLSKRLEQEREEMAKMSGMEPEEIPVAEGLVVRVVVSVEKQLEVRQKFIDILHGEDYPSGFTYRSKLIFLFQKIEGVDVCLFGMCVQEFGSECGGPNQRCVYISYLDSVKYFRPERKCVTGESLRTFVYHEILIGYLEYCKKRGFATCYIWACPLIKGEDYIFYCHPETQRTPKQDKLRQWYKSMLKKATEDNLVVDHTNLYNQFFVPSGECNTKITAARLPYFDGDYWSGAAENIVRKLEVEERVGGLQSKLPNKRILKAMGQDKADVAMKDVLVMQKLGQTILPVKENFMIVHLHHICTHCHEVILSGSRWFCSNCKKIQLCSRCIDADKNISESKIHRCHSGEKKVLSEVVVNDVTLDTKDTDDVFVNSFFETRDAFLNKCQKSHFQFDTLSRAKYSSMMILYHLIYKPIIKPICTACRTDVVVDLCWQCDICAKYYICDSCYKRRCGACHPHRLNPPSMELVCGSKTQQLRMLNDLMLKTVLDTLIHASECDRMPCAYKECTLMRRLFYHAARCIVRARGGCRFCKRVWRILKEHVKICTDSDCKIPRCMDIKRYKELLAAQCADQQATMRDQQEVAELRVA